MSFSGPTHVISVEIDESQLSRYTDSFLATAWHVAQLNPAPHGDRAAGELAERVGREIIRRWLKGVPPELWHHQGRDYSRQWLTTFARYVPGAADVTDPQWKDGTWVLKDAEPAEGGAES
jgi:hypothetical protein